jgi:hypothetical protein
MSDPFTIALWCADTTRFASMVASHLLTEGIHAANSGRIENHLPVVVGVANTRRWPVLARTVAARGVIRARTPHITTVRQHHYLLTVVSGASVDSGGAPRAAAAARVIDAHKLVMALEAVTPSELSSEQLVDVFASVAQQPLNIRVSKEVDVMQVADSCQRLVSALAR